MHDRKHANYRHLVPIDPYIISCASFGHACHSHTHMVCKHTYIQRKTNAKKLKFIKLVYTIVVHTLRHIFAKTNFSFARRHTSFTLLQPSIWSDAFAWSRGWRKSCGGNRCAWFFPSAVTASPLFWVCSLSLAENVFVAEAFASGETQQTRGEIKSQKLFFSFCISHIDLLSGGQLKICWHHIRTANMHNMRSVEFYECSQSAVMCVKFLFKWKSSEITWPLCYARNVRRLLLLVTALELLIRNSCGILCYLLIIITLSRTIYIIAEQFHCKWSATSLADSMNK